VAQLNQFEELEKVVSHRVTPLTEPIECGTVASPRSLDSGMWVEGDKDGLEEGAMTLRWLAKRKRTGPKAA